MPPIFKLRTADGRIVPIRASSPDEAFEILDQIESESKPGADLRAVESKFTVNPDPESPMSRFVGGVASSLNPVTMAKGIYQTIAHPIDTAGALLDAQIATGAKADEAERAGRGSEAAGYRVASGIPLLGPMIAGLGEQAGSGDIAGAAGSLTGALAAPGVYGKALQSGKAVAPAVMRSAGNAAQTVARGAGKAAMVAGPEVVGAAAGNAAGGLLGGALGMGIGNRILRPMVAKFLRERMGMSNVRAQEAAARMPESELVKIAQDAMPPQGVPPQGPLQPSPMTASAPGGQAMVQAPPVPRAPVSSGVVPSTAIDPSRLGTLPGAVPPRPPSPVTSGMAPLAVEIDPARLGQVQVRPIPPSKMPVRPPDPVVPELDTQMKPSGAGANARQWLQDYAAADLAGRQKLVKGLAGKLSYEDMRQLGAYTDDITTMNPATAPAAVDTHFRPAKLADLPPTVSSSGTVADEAVARAARQKEHIAETYRAKAAKEAKNEADSVDLEAQLMASLKPKEPVKAVPDVAVDMAQKIQERVLAGKKAGLSRGQIKAGILETMLKRSDGYKPADVQRLIDMILKESK